jgi:hypothetical protein
VRTGPASGARSDADERLWGHPATGLA